MPSILSVRTPTSVDIGDAGNSNAVAGPSPETPSSRPATDIRLRELSGSSCSPSRDPSRGSSRGSSSSRARSPRPPDGDLEANRRPLFDTLPKDWAGLRSQVTAARSRPIDTAEVAAIVNEVRGTGARAIREDKLALSAEALLARVDEQYLDRWRKALGMEPEDLSAQQRAQRSANHLLLVARLAPSALQYGVVPAVGIATGDPMKTFYASAVLSIANLVINAMMQPVTAGTSEFIQARGGPSIKLDEKSVNFKHRMPIEAANTREAARQLDAANHALRQCLDEAFGPDVPADAPDIHTRLSALAPEQRARLISAYRHVADTGKQASNNAATLMMVMTGLLRQSAGYRSQALLRISRPPLAAVASLLGPHRTNLLSSREVLFVSIGIVLASLVVQFLLLAPRDQKRKVDAKHRLNALFADVVKPESRAKIDAGLTLAPEDMDENKLRKLVVSPAEAMLERAFKATELALDRYPPERRRVIDQALKDWKADRLDWLARSGDGAAHPEISGRAVDVARHASGGGLWRAAIGAKWTRREMTDEMMRSFCKSFQLGVLGSAGAQLIPRLVNGLAGGASKVPLPGYLGLLGVSLLSSAASAFSEDMIVTLVNTRKKEDPEQQPAIWRDLGTGMAALIVKYLNQRQASSALRDADAALTNGAFVAALDFVAHEPGEAASAAGAQRPSDAGAASDATTEAPTCATRSVTEKQRAHGDGFPDDATLHDMAASLGTFAPDRAFFAGLHAAVTAID
ncbi:hypothetical protein PQQ51_00970 [Paraburkholderia xenovorans]|uniref:hypothetical protein n=1 Tax=Paraburkholderia xenovorans TaxID=36873 RepID=UPI0038BB591D